MHKGPGAALRLTSLLVGLAFLAALVIAAPASVVTSGDDVAHAASHTAAAKQRAAAKKRRAARPCRATRKGPVVRSPGYRGACRAIKTRPAQPLPPVTLSPNGRFPDLIVDNAGTAHIVWTEDGGDGPDRLRYCRLKRATRGCDNPPATQAMFPDQPYVPGSPPAFNDDTAGPAVAAVGNDLALLTYRYPIVVPKPVGDPSSSSTYLWVSDDGGQSLTGPGLVGDLEPTGGVAVFGPPDAPRIAVVTDTKTGGTFFQSIAPGTYTGSRLNLGASGPDRAYSGSVATVGGLPLVAFSDLSTQTFIRQWSGAGSPEDGTHWTEAVIPGVEPRVTSGAAGAFIVNRPQFLGPLQVRRLTGVAAGVPVTVSTSRSVGSRDLFADPGGTVRLAWVDRDATPYRLMERSSRNGTAFGAARLLARGAGLDHVEIASAGDGGGFATYVSDPVGSQGYGTVKASPFGSQQPTGLPGLGNQPGGGAAPGTQVGCQEISYGAVQILAEAGCLLSAAGQQAVKVSEGPLRLNGLEIIPDAGVKILLGTRERTIDSTGRVTVQLRAPGGPIVLFRGELHLKLPAIGSGARLATFKSSQFPVNVKGFPVQGDIDVILRDKSVEIPISLKLPKAFGGLTGQTVLKASNARGLEVSSVRFGVGNLTLGPVVLRNLDIRWASGGNWAGGGEVQVAGAALAARLEFANGRFNRGFVSVTPVPFPGVPLFTNVFLNRISGDLQIDPFSIAVGGVVGFQPITPPDVYVFGIDAQMRISTRPVFAITVTGSGKLAGFQMATSRMYGDANGYFSVNSSARLSVAEIVEAGVEFNGFVDAGRGQFGASAGFDGCVGKAPVHVCGGFQGVLSSRGIAGCANSFIGVGYRWGGSARLLGPFGCNMSDYEAPAQSSAAGNRARASAVPGERSFSLPAGLPHASVRLTGAGEPPQVVVVSPSGARLTPVPVNDPAAPNGVAAVIHAGNDAYVGLRRPAAGTWRVEPVGGAAITELAVARGLAPPRVTGKVARTAAGKGRGAARRANPRAQVLTYRATSRPGLAVHFFEQVGRGGRLIATTSRARGQIRFNAGDGPAGRRPIYAVVEQDGLPTLRRVIARYRAPGPVRPTRVRGLRIKRTARAATVTWRRSPGISDYAVRVSVSDGRRLLRLPRAPRIRISGLTRADRLTVSVAGRTATGRTGPAATARHPQPRRRAPNRRPQAR